MAVQAQPVPIIPRPYLKKSESGWLIGISICGKGKMKNEDSKGNLKHTGDPEALKY